MSHFLNCESVFTVDLMKSLLGNRLGKDGALWDREVSKDDDIRRVFGVSNSAVSHIVKDLKERMK